ncbi:hypothetical protein [Phytomonospora endophytica]|uniref:Uncharacterized protein n=1 Tax=Phytomonospora endophytica TaxID=714109 RepID=A0A841FH01_9ACTN|nr:hypothetical protein [Phytomonospora endophytica]MBB6034273.1 hypothetical protein [Phytomonospora endophytica]GIG66666.1 hypothetical protein Pen01_29610 [Phytomonospora endophytica]
MSELVVSFEPEPGLDPPATTAVPGTAPVLLRVLAGMEALGFLGIAWLLLGTRVPVVLKDEVVGFAVHALAGLVFTVLLLLLARGVRRGSARARLASFGYAGFVVLSAFYGLLDLTDLLNVVGTPRWNLSYVLPSVGSWLLGSLPPAIVGVFLFRALAAPALRDHCEPRGV